MFTEWPQCCPLLPPGTALHLDEYFCDLESSPMAQKRLFLKTLFLVSLCLNASLFELMVRSVCITNFPPKGREWCRHPRAEQSHPQLAMVGPLYALSPGSGAGDTAVNRRRSVSPLTELPRETVMMGVCRWLCKHRLMRAMKEKMGSHGGMQLGRVVREGFPEEMTFALRHGGCTKQGQSWSGGGTEAKRMGFVKVLEWTAGGVFVDLVR